MRALAFALLLVLAGCNAFGSNAVTLTTDRDRYAPGSVATLTLRNNGDETVSMSPLTCARLGRRAGGLWTRGDARACPRIIVNVPAGEAVTGRFDLEDVDAGTYRFVHETSAGDAVSGAFEVR